MSAARKRKWEPTPFPTGPKETCLVSLWLKPRVRRARFDKQAVIENRVAFPDWLIAIDDLIAEGDQVVARWHAQGTHTGAAWGIAPSGKHLEMAGITIVRVVNGKITDFWKQDNGYRFWQSLADDTKA